MYDDESWSRRKSRNLMTTASVILGVLALMSCSIFYISLPCGALAIICAILSRDCGMAKRSIAGIVCGAIGIVLSVSITIYAVYYVLTNENGRSWLEYYLQMYTGNYDLSLDEFLNELYGTDGNSSDGDNIGSSDSLPGDSGGSGSDQPDGGSGNGGNSGGSGSGLPDEDSGNGGGGNSGGNSGDDGGSGGDSLPGDNYNDNNGSGNGNFVNYVPGDSGVYRAILPLCLTGSGFMS